MNYYEQIKNKLIDNEVYQRVKDYSKEKNTLITHYEVGKLLSMAGSIYGEDIIGNYSKKLVLEVNKKYNSRTLRRMRQLYFFFEKQKWSPQGTNLSTSHIRELFGIDDVNKLNYYVKQVLNRNLSKRELATIIQNKEYERLSEETKAKLITKEETKVEDLIKNPILIKNSSNYDEISEKILQKLILEDIESFMKELGNSFCFIGSEYKIKIGDRYNYIDLLLFNIEFNCYIIIELKVTELKKEHIGQIEVYMNYIDKNIKKITQDKTIGIIICKKNNRFVMEYCSDKRILSKEYELV